MSIDDFCIIYYNKEYDKLDKLSKFLVDQYFIEEELETINNE